MLEEFIQSPVTRRRLLDGLAGPYVAEFAAWLHERGYTEISIRGILKSLAAWTDWLGVSGLSLENAAQAVEICADELKSTPKVLHARGPNRASISAARNLVRFLQERNVVPTPKPAPSPAQRWPLIGAFRSWMYQHRGLAESTLKLYEGVIVDLLQALGDDPQTYTALQLRTFVFERAQPHGLWRAKSIVVASRAFLRFLGATGRAPLGLEHALPTFSSRSLVSLPRFIEPAALERVIASCEPARLGRSRDRAVVLLLARLGLRAGEVARLQLGDIDWRRGRLTVSGKNRRPEWLPLPQEVGDAILDWLQTERPSIEQPSVFTTVKAPHRPMSRAAVTHVVRGAFRRAGVQSPVNGAHALRHSAATAMLREGASLAGVGAVLRHRAPGTTALYAKVDMGLLSEIAQPWPGEASC